jgi:hypothetical protein
MELIIALPQTQFRCNSIAYPEEVTSAIIRQAFLPSKLAEAMKRYGTINMADMNEFMDKGAGRCSTFSNDDTTSEERLFSDGESTISSVMTSVGDESEPPDSTERSKDKEINKIESDLTVAVADVGGDKPAGDSKSFHDRVPQRCLILDNPSKLAINCRILKMMKA